MLKIKDEAYLYQGKLPKYLREYSDKVFDELWNCHPQDQGVVRMFGKLTKVPRFQQPYMKSYKFSGVNHQAIDLPDKFNPYLEWINKQKYHKYNGVLVNYYRNGDDYIGRHSDNESELAKGVPIVSISLGKTRTFRLRDKENNESIIKDIKMPNNTYLIMAGKKFQTTIKHEVIKEKYNEDEDNRRINITFRVFV